MKLDLPKIGLRNIKTALSVCICIFLFPNDPFYASIASVVCMQGSVEGTVKSGINRLCGTLLGGLIGVFLLIATRHFNMSSFNFIITGIGVSIVIYLCNLVKKPASCSIACIVLVAITTAPPSRDPIEYAVKRILETACGVVVAILVNKYIHPPKEKTNVKK